MTDSELAPDLSKIRAELQQIIAAGISSSNVDWRGLPDDVSILDLGISSMELVEGMRRVYDRFGVLISIRRVIEGQVTLAGLALVIEQELRTQQSLKRKAPTSEKQWKVQRSLTLAPSQRHIGFLSRYSNEASAAFNEALLLRLQGPLDGPALHTAVETVGERYEALRTALNPDSNSLDVGTGEPLELVVAPISAGELQQRLSEIVARPFETGKRLFRAELLRLSDTEHVLVLVGHALLLEQESLAYILADIAGLYRVFSRDEQAGPAPAALQWVDYLAFGETSEAGHARQVSEAYWKEIYASPAPRLELPADFPRPPVKRYSGSRLAIPLDPELVERLEPWATAAGTDLNTLLFGALTAYLPRLSGQAELVIGVESQPLYPNTGLPAIASTRNVLPVRSSYDPETTFQDHLRAQVELLDRAQTHRYLSLAELIQLLQLPRDQSRSALFSAAWRTWAMPAAPVFETTLKDSAASRQVGLESNFLLPPSAGARYDLEVIAATLDGGRWLVCDYSTELFAEETISRWLNGFLAFLEAAVQDPSAACGRLPLMPEQQLQQVLYDWNQTEKDYDRQRTVLDFIREQVQTRPAQTAIRFGEISLSYAQLNQRLENIAAALHNGGFRPGDRVGILLQRGPDLIPAMLAAWRVGALYVPLDISFPAQRLAYMLADASVHTVITTRAQLAQTALTLDSANPLFLEDINLLTAPSNGRTSPTTGNHSAILLYTSGSTGQPKGVEIRHAALLNILLAVREYLNFTPASKMLALTTFSFDISTAELIMPLLAGGCVDLGEDGLVADGLKLAERIEQRQPTHIQATPSSWKALLSAGWQGSPELSLSSAGEALSRDLAEQLLTRCHSLWNLYGPTETTVYSSASQVFSDPGRPISIGRPVPNTRLYILDQLLQPVPPGVAGELYIGGEGLARGYWQRPELTSQRFVANPFLPGQRMYRTGDLARYQPDGQVICMGRADDQVKIHGVRVELGEVESALRAVPGVRDAVAASWKNAQGDTQLVGHIIPATPDGLSASEIRAHLRQRLPEVMVPPYILFTEAFPLTANGKVRRASLPEPGEIRPEAIEASAAPATPTEQKLAQVWAGVLGIQANLIGRDADFMDLGGHSLLMTPLMVEVRKLFKISLSLGEFFGASTLRKFAALVDERLSAASALAQQGDNGSSRQGSTSTRSAEWARQRMSFLQREAQLPLYIAPARGQSYQAPAEIRSVFMTGATGFLGAYIIAEILTTTDAELYCLVRPQRRTNGGGNGSAAHIAVGKERIEKQMRHFQVWQDDEAWQIAWDRRLHVVEGDVTLPRLGLPDAIYERLAREVDIILHGAAHVNFIYPYEALRATNVLGTHEMIRFAFHSRIKPIHHLSTAAIWPMGAQYTFYQRDSIDHGGVLNLGYDEAKWVSERCLIHAGERGLPVARYRPGEVGGDSVTGRCVTEHFLIASVKGFLQFGAFPDIDIEVDVAPVDYVAKALVHLAFRRNSLGHAFHLTNPHRRRMGEALAYLRGLGYQFDELPFEQLRDRLVSSQGFSSNALFAYQAALESMDGVSMQLPTYDTRETLRELEGSGITCPPADEKLFETYLNYLQSIGFIPQPEQILARL